MNDSSRLMDQIGKVGNQMSTLQAFKSLQQDRTDAFNNALRHTESVVQSVTGLTGGGLLMKAADPVIQKLGIFQKSTAAAGEGAASGGAASSGAASGGAASGGAAAGGAEDLATQISAFDRVAGSIPGRPLASAQEADLPLGPEPTGSVPSVADALTDAGKQAAADVGKLSGDIGGAADAAAGAADSAIVGSVGAATSASTALDWNPVGLAVTAVLGLGTVLAGVFGHKKEESVPRHSPDQPTVANVSTQFGV